MCTDYCNNHIVPIALLGQICFSKRNENLLFSGYGRCLPGTLLVGSHEGFESSESEGWLVPYQFSL